VVAGLCAALAWGATGGGAFAAAPSGPAPLAAPPAAHAAKSVSVRGVIGSVTSLVVRRGTPLNPTTFTFPKVVSVKGAAARAVARDLCALPVMPKGIFCPADLGGRYTLDFTATGSRVTPVVLDASGCETVQGLHGIRWTARSPHLWSELGDAMGLRGATQSTFAGHMTGS